MIDLPERLDFLQWQVREIPACFDVFQRRLQMTTIGLGTEQIGRVIVKRKNRFPCLEDGCGFSSFHASGESF